MERKVIFAIAHVMNDMITKCLPYMDVKTDYAFRRTQKSLSAQLDLIRKKVQSDQGLQSKIDAYEQCVKECNGRDLARAKESCPDGFEAHKEVMSTEITFDVFQLDADVLDKSWPQREHDGNGAQQDAVFKELLAELEMISHD